jgi:hypothetical protein
MTDVRSYFEKTYLGAWDLPEGKDVVVVLDRCEGSMIKGTTGESKKAPVLYFKDKKKGMVLNVTNAKTLIRLYGRHVEQWGGKPVALFASRTLAFGEEVDCIRIRPEAPALPAAKKGTSEAQEAQP